MPTVTLLAKTYSSFQLKLAGKYLRSILEGLKVDIDIEGSNARGWIHVTVSGEDEKVALHYLAEEIGLCPTSLEDVKKFSIIKGRLMAVDQSKNELRVDIGTFSPKNIDVIIPLQSLQVQLVDGRKVALKKIVELFGFCENLPLTVKILKIDAKENSIEAMLSENQLAQYKSWIRSLLDRLIIIGASSHEIRLTLKKTGFNRDVINVDSLGFFEQAIACKFGTDAVGLIPRIGKHLRNANLSTFNPRKILQFLGDQIIS